MGYREFTVQIKDLRTGKMLPDEIKKVSYSLAWAADNRTLFYATIDHAKRPYRINAMYWEPTRTNWFTKIRTNNTT